MLQNKSRRGPKKVSKQNSNKRRNKQADVIAKLNAVEEKYLDLTAQGSPAATSAFSLVDPTTVACLNGTAQGDTGITREGREIVMKELELRGRIYRDTQTGGGMRNAGLVRLLLVLDKQSNLGVPTPNEVVIPTNSLPVQSFKNLLYDKRYVILRDETFHIDSPVATDDATNGFKQGGNTKEVHWVVPLNNMKTTFVDAAGTIASISDKSLHVLIASNLGTGISIEYVSRLRFFG